MEGIRTVSYTHLDVYKRQVESLQTFSHIGTYAADADDADGLVQKDAWYDTANSRSCYAEYPAFHLSLIHIL